MTNAKAVLFSILCILVVVMLAAGVIFTLVDRAINRNGQYSNTAEYTIQTGDTLWSIAKRYALPSTDKWEWIDKVVALNPGIRMQPGEVILLYTAQQTNG